LAVKVERVAGRHGAIVKREVYRERTKKRAKPRIGAEKRGSERS